MYICISGGGCATARVIFVTGFKGGVGKTTVAANVAASLCALGRTVLVIDGDFGMRCMDMVLGVESETLFDCSDVLSGECSERAAMTDIPSCPGLSFIPAPMNYRARCTDKAAYAAMVDGLRGDFDYIIIDSCAEATDYYTAFAAAADEALIVTLHQSTSVRAAEQTAARLYALGLKSAALVLNGYREKFAAAGELPSIPDIIERSSVRLAGVVPFDERLPASQESAYLAFTGDKRRKASGSEIAFLNIAVRLDGGRVRLFDGVSKPKRRCDAVEIYKSVRRET